MTKIYIPLLSFLIILQQLTPLRADTLELIEGSILVGKITEESDDSVVISNLYGSFKIKRNYIKSIHKTQDYTKDVKMLEGLNLEVDPEAVRKQVEAGMRKKAGLREEMLKKLEEGKWKEGTIGISGSFNYVLGKISNVIPYGYSARVSIDQGMDMLIDQRRAIMPGLRAEAEYLNYSKGPYTISGYSTGIGLIWMFPVLEEKKGFIILAALPGISFISIENTEADKKAGSNTITGTGIVGYRYMAGAMSFFIHARYMYVYDKQAPLQSIGAEAGVGFRVW